MAKRKATPTKPTTAKAKAARIRFLKLLADGLSISGAAKGARMNRQWAYEQRAADSEFAQAWDQAIEAGTDALEDAARKRAMQSSDSLMQFLLKGRRPNKYRENIRVENIDVSQLTDEQLEAIVAGTIPSGVRVAPTPANDGHGN